MKRIPAILSIHDVTPAWQEEIEYAYLVVRENSEVAPTLLVVPDFHRECHLSNDPDFVSTIRDWITRGSELLLHGYSHLSDLKGENSVSRRVRAFALTAGEGEFLTLPPDEIRFRVAKGIQVLSVLNTMPLGFVAPAWLYNRHLFPALKDEMLGISEGHFYIYDIMKKKRVFMPAISFCARDVTRAAASTKLAKVLPRVVPQIFPRGFRLALHPVDFRSKELVTAISELLVKTSDVVEWTTYSAIMNNKSEVHLEARQ